MATYYANRFSGRKTASGERYNPRALTAAHKTLPLGTVVRVSRVDGVGETVVVKINDRGPYAPGRIIDLSLAAAKRLDMLRAGVVRVRVEVVSRPDR
jgi:peptidoglycan lytic transglycosylase